ncbi:MAG: helix-hairpin-helix domain-containing protein [Nanoarchaeota archaeon]|nr:helix-hairpin-helix domain-containing protein [Nanoarchaeota archaeon]
MKKLLYGVALLILIISFVSASCVDINSASLEELDEIIWVGPATAQKIIDARPFDSLDDLDKVSGIGKVKISDIKDEGLACIDGEVNEDLEEEFEEEELAEIVKIVKIDEEEIVLLEKPREIVLSSEPPEIISLNDNSGKELVYESKNFKIMRYLPYVFSVFLIVLLGILFWGRF